MNLYALVLALIVLALLSVSVSQVRKTRTKADYLVAGRTLPWYVLVFTLLSSWIGSGSLFAGAENAFRNGFSALWQAAGGWCGLLVIYFIAPRARKFAQFTIPDLLETRYDVWARVLGATAILFAFTAIASYQFKGGGDILHIIFPGLDVAARETFGLAPGKEHALGMVIIAVFVVLFTALAGMASVAYMDVVIGGLTTVAALLSVPFLLARSEAGAGSTPRSRPSTSSPSAASAARAAVRPGDGAAGPDHAAPAGQPEHLPEVLQRPDRARRAAVGRLLARRDGAAGDPHRGHRRARGGDFLHTPGIKAREIIPYTARNGVPSLVGAILVGAIFAKVISTANNYLFSPATNLVNDVYTRFVNPEAPDRVVLRVSRVLIVLLGLFALLQGTVSESILAMSLYAYTVYAAAITPVVLSAFFWRRATAAGAVVCILAGTAITLFWNLEQLALEAHRTTLLPGSWLARDAIFPALLVSVVSLVLVSLFTPAPAPEKWQPFAATEARAP
jgi:Na+/proline symporter